MSTQSQRADAFRALHEGDPFVIPNPWDAGSARVLAALGFPALATTSSGLAMSLGRRDGEVSLGEVVRHVGALTDATDLPVSVDLERGHGDHPADAARAITAVAAAGAVGASIEDWSAAAGIDPVGAAAERIAAAVAAARSLPHDFVLTARAENHIRGNPDLGDTIARLQAYERAGADVLYAPGLRSVAEVRQVCAAVSRPVNVLALPGLDVPGIFAAGAQRVSVGGGLARVAMRALADAAIVLRDRGDVEAFAVALPLDEWFG